MKFNEYKYERPNIEEVQKEVSQLLEQFKQAETKKDAIATLEKINNIQSDISTNSTLTSIRYSINTQDEFYKKESEFWDESSPVIQNIFFPLGKAILTSKFLEDLKAVYPKTYFYLLENEEKSFSAEIIPLLQEENKLSTEYSTLVASAQVEFEGQSLTIVQFGPYLQSLDRNTRKKAVDTMNSFFEENETKFDEIYDKLVKVRTEIAHKLGFKNFVELGYVRMNRFDYDADMVATYRKEIIKHVVPVVAELRKRQAKRLGLNKLNYYDLALEYPSGNATPIGTPDEILANGKKMYTELSPETTEFINFMYEHDLLDVLSKPGKAGGGYCTYIPNYEAPFIFANFNKTSHDIDVLTHEAGHAFQVFRSRYIKPEAVIWPTYETCEIHSMSMEFITWPWMESFFGDQTNKYKFSHLASGIQFLPYGVCVDHFQHEVYENPDLTPAQRKEIWKKLEALYLPDRDYSESAYYSKGTFWVKQAHIFASPFYYIDYTLAQICAFQFWKRTQVDKDPTAWNDYLAICNVGGTKSFLEVVKLANLQSPFKEGALESTINSIKHYLDNVSDESL